MQDPRSPAQEWTRSGCLTSCSHLLGLQASLDWHPCGAGPGNGEPWACDLLPRGLTEGWEPPAWRPCPAQRMSCSRPCGSPFPWDLGTWALPERHLSGVEEGSGDSSAASRSVKRGRLEPSLSTEQGGWSRRQGAPRLEPLCYTCFSRAAESIGTSASVCVHVCFCV